MARKLKVETMQKRTADHKQLTIEELEYCKRLIDTIIKDVEKVEYQHLFDLDNTPSEAKYAADEAYQYMATVRGILSRYWKNKDDVLLASRREQWFNNRIFDKHKAFKSRMNDVLYYVDEMDGF